MMKYLHVIIIICLLNLISLKGQENRIKYNNQNLFLSGMNLAWVNFGSDLSNFNQTEFARALEDVKRAKGNTIRWWLHVNGTNTPQFTNDSVTGNSVTSINNLRTALDMAQEKGIGLVLCLWSFDMLQSTVSAEQKAKNTKLLTDPIYTTAYIRNSLIPMVDSVKGHPAIICWEIFNEAEGMVSDINNAGWASKTIKFDPYIQRFINRTVGAIHRTDPNALVTSGSWSFLAQTDVKVPGGTNKNYYRDDRLIAAGGDVDGTLDFYMVHYYSWAKTNYSPFHHAASYWGLNKPLVVAEFAAKGPYTGISPEIAYKNLYDSGYAGALAWTWTGHDGNGNTEDARPGMEYLYNNHLADVEVIIDSSTINFTPYIKHPLENISMEFPTDSLIIKYTNLDYNFYDHENSPGLVYTIQSNSNPELVNAILVDSDSLYIGIKPNQAGSAIITIKATDSTSKYITSQFTVGVFDATSADKARYRSASASSIDGVRIAMNAVDGDNSSRWSSLASNNQWLKVELEKPRNIQRIWLDWSTTYAKAYNILLSTDGVIWDTAYNEVYGNGSADLIIIEPTLAKYIKLDCFSRSNQWGYALWSLEAYETPGANTLPYSISTDDITTFVGVKLSKKLSTLISDSTSGDQLTFEVSLQNGSPLPKWLSFKLPNDQLNAILTGTPLITDTGKMELKIVATDRYGIKESFSINLIVSKKTSSTKANSITNIKIFPNPALSQINIEQNLEFPLNKIDIIDLQGKTVKSFIPDVSSNLIQIDISELDNGLYYLYLHNQQGVLPYKIVKTN